MIEAKLREYKTLHFPPPSPAPSAPTTAAATTSATPAASSSTPAASSSTPAASSSSTSSSQAATRDVTPQAARDPLQGAQNPPMVPVPQPPRVNPHHLQQLFDMGFTREQGEEALLACGDSVTASMEWLLSHPGPSAQAVGLFQMYIHVYCTLLSLLYYSAV